jgi:hypothetical protein
MSEMRFGGLGGVDLIMALKMAIINTPVVQVVGES